MSADLVLRSSCSGCGSPSNLYGSSCKHMTLCFSCGKSMAQRRAKCLQCGTILTRLIREYNIRQSSSTDKNFFIGRFVKGLPSFPRKKNGNNAAANKWSLHKEGLQGRQVSDSLREKYKNKPWVLEDETGQFQYQGNFDGAAIANYYVLFKQGNEFLAVPAGSWFNFNKVAQYKQLTLEEAEEKIKNKKKAGDGYGRWMMKAAKNGAALFGQVESFDNDDNAAAGGGKGRKQTVIGVDDEEDEGIGSDGDEEEMGMKNRLNKSGDDDDVEKGDDWEHEDIFSDDDEAVGNQEEGKDLEPEVPAPPEFLQDDDEDENEEEGEKEGGLSKSGKEIKELLRVNKDEEDDNVDDDDDDEDMDDVDDIAAIPEVVPSKPVANSGSRKRKSNGDDSVMASHSKKIKTENEQKPPSIQKEPAVSSCIKTVVPPKAAPLVKMERTSSSTSCVGLGAVTEEEIRAVIVQKTTITTTGLVARFKERLGLPEEKRAFADILKRICKIQKGTGNQKPTVVLLDQKVTPAKV